MLKVEELRKVTPEELSKELTKAQHELAKIKMQVTDNNASQNHKIRDLKKYIARINTINTENLKK